MSLRKIVFVTSQPKWLNPWVQRADEAGLEAVLITPESLDDLTPRAFKGADAVVEWLPVAGQCKEPALKKLDALLPPEVLILSAAHEVMATTLASWLGSPERLAGFSPMGLYRESQVVSLARPAQLANAAARQAEDVFSALKLPVVWTEDTPGMVLSRICAMLANEAAFALQEGVATARDIDLAMRLGTNYPFGPLEWADKVGLDVVLGILNSLWHAYRDERYRPCLLLQKMVQAGQCGVLTGKGFYTYTPEEPPQPARIVEEKSQV